MRTLPRSRWNRPKIIQIELNHILPPPIAYKDMCREDAPSGYSFDVWGCSMQAAYDIVRPFGFRLLQYNWPDGVFIHEDYVDAFPLLPWLTPENFAAAYWNGRTWADEIFERMKLDAADREWVAAMMTSVSSAWLHPRHWLTDHIIKRWNETWIKRPLWIEMGVTGTGVSVRIECDSPIKKELAVDPFGRPHDNCTRHGFKHTWTSCAF